MVFMDYLALWSCGELSVIYGKSLSGITLTMLISLLLFLLPK